jgi:hypothetical protein
MRNIRYFKDAPWAICKWYKKQGLNESVRDVNNYWYMVPMTFDKVKETDDLTNLPISNNYDESDYISKIDFIKNIVYTISDIRCNVIYDVMNNNALSKIDKENVVIMYKIKDIKHVNLFDINNEEDVANLEKDYESVSYKNDFKRMIYDFQQYNWINMKYFYEEKIAIIAKVYELGYDGFKANYKHGPSKYECIDVVGIFTDTISVTKLEPYLCILNDNLVNVYFEKLDSDNSQEILSMIKDGYSSKEQMIRQIEILGGYLKYTKQEQMNIMFPDKKSKDLQESFMQRLLGNKFL